MSDAPLRILIVRLSHLGDVVQALPLHHALRGAYPRARIAWAVQPEFAGLLEGLPGLERTIRFERRAGASAWPRLARDLEEFGADWSIDAQGNVKSALVALASRAGRRSGYAREDWREGFAATSVTDPCPAGPPVEHAVERVLRLTRHVAPAWRAEPRFDAGLAGPEIEAGERRLAELVTGPGGVLLHLSPPGDVRSWSIERFAELARAGADRGSVLIVSGPTEEAHGRALATELRHPRIAHVVGQRGLRELAALFTAAARRGIPFVGCDSGPMHVAWSSGMRVVLLAGPQDERRTGPFGVRAHHRVIHGQRRPDCAPCRSRTCSHRDGPVCMCTIAVGEVADAL
ncbi:MAG: glycosyltransferase family 9 protein [Planctomycetota bacterium]|nr:glycosyltransferase family 9 protein [Planctomycetota bacterium]